MHGHYSKNFFEHSEFNTGKQGDVTDTVPENQAFVVMVTICLGSAPSSTLHTVNVLPPEFASVIQTLAEGHLIMKQQCLH